MSRLPLVLTEADGRWIRVTPQRRPMMPTPESSANRKLAHYQISPSLGSGVGLIVNVHHVLDRKLRVALRGRQPLMPEQFLDGAQVRSLFQHVRAEGVTQSMRMNVGRQSFSNRDSLDDAAYAARGEASAALVD